MKLDCLAVGLTRDSLPASVAQSPNAFEMSGNQTVHVGLSACFEGGNGQNGVVSGAANRARFATITTDE
jgi:hypothetical protein